MARLRHALSQALRKHSWTTAAKGSTEAKEVAEVLGGENNALALQVREDDTKSMSLAGNVLRLPHTRLIRGRPHWLITLLGCRPVNPSLRGARRVARDNSGMVADEAAYPLPLMLPRGKYVIEAQDPKGNVTATEKLDLREPMNLPMNPSDLDHVAEPELLWDIAERYSRDQKLREALAGAIKSNRPENMKPLEIALHRVDTENTAWLKKVVQRRGWLGKSSVGENGARAAWLLVQHADADRAFQRRVLQLMEPLVPKGEVSPSDFAYLTDRVLVADGKPQRYGTQFRKDGSGKWEPHPIESPDQVDERRKTVGLPPLEEYRKQIEQLYGGG